MLEVGVVGDPLGDGFFRGKTPTKNRGQIMNNLETNMVKPSAPTSGMRCGTSTWSQSLEIPDFGFCLPLKRMGNSTHCRNLTFVPPKSEAQPSDIQREVGKPQVFPIAEGPRMKHEAL